MEAIGRWVLGLGVLLAAVGVLLIAAGRLGLPLGRLPGDIAIERDGLRFYLPLGTCLAISALLSLIAWLAARLR